MDFPIKHGDISHDISIPFPYAFSIDGLEDLRQLGRPMERLVLVDNSPVSLALCLDNGIIVSNWTEKRLEQRKKPQV